MDQVSASLPWDVKDHLTAAEASSMSEHLIRCANRHAHLVGDIPFQSLYTTPFRELVPLVLPRLQQICDLGLHEDQDALIALVSSLQWTLADDTLGDLATRPRADFSPAALELLAEAKKTGITLPQPTDNTALLARRLAAKRGLLAATPTATLKSVLAHETRDRETQAVIQEAQNSRLLPTVIYPSSCQIGFISFNDGKDFDSLLTVTLYNPANQKIAVVSSDFGEFPAHASSGPFPMNIMGGANKDEQELKSGSLKFNFLPNGNDVWLFSFQLFVSFPDGGHFSVDGPQDGITAHYALTQDITEFTVALSTLNSWFTPG